MNLEAAHPAAGSCHVARCLTGASAQWCLVAASGVVVIVIAVALFRLVLDADADWRARLRDACAALVQHVLLFGFAAVAAAISAHGLIGFARQHGVARCLAVPAVGGAGRRRRVVCGAADAAGSSRRVGARAAAGGVGTGSRVERVQLDSRPHHPGAREAFALMPLIAAILFEFSLRETRHTAERSERRLTGLQWLHPIERVRVQFELAADQTLSTPAAIRRVRVSQAAWSLHRLRVALGTQTGARQT